MDLTESMNCFNNLYPGYVTYAGLYVRGVGEDSMNMDVYISTYNYSYSEFIVTPSNCAFLGSRDYIEGPGKVEPYSYIEYWN